MKLLGKKVIVVDDELLIRKTLQDLLSIDYETICFESAEVLLEAFKKSVIKDDKPTCILLDFQMPGMNGVGLQTSLKKMNVNFPIIFMSGNAEQEDIINAWRGGGADFLLKPFTAHQLIDILSKHFDLLEKQAPTSQGQLYSASSATLQITQREAQVLLMLGQGLQQVDIAKALGITLRTVKMHRANLKDKLYLNTLMELGRYCDNNKELITKIASQ